MKTGGKLVLGKDKVILKQQVETPIGKHFHESEIDYDQLNKKMRYIKVKSIKPILKGDTFKIEIDYSSFKRREKVEKIELSLRKSHIEYSHIYIPTEFRDLFPGYENPFTIETEVGEIETYITGAPTGTEKGDPTAGSYFSKGMTKWFKEHPELEAGDKVTIEIVEPKQRYRLRVKSIPKILIVEDNQQVLDLLQTNLKRSELLDCELSIARTGEEALSQLKKESFDIILSDHKMPGMNGLELLTTIKNQYPTPARILITGYPDAISPEEKNKAGLWDSIEKPWKKEELEQTILKALREKRKRKVQTK